MLLREGYAAVPSREQVAYRVNRRRATEECGHHSGARRPPQTPKILVPLGKTNQQKDQGICQEGDELPGRADETIPGLRNEPPARGEIPKQHAGGKRRENSGASESLGQ